MMRSARKVVIAGAMALLGGVGLWIVWQRPLENPRVRTYVFDAGAVARLTEDIALRFSRRAVERTEHVKSLKPLPDDRATPPDRYLVRNTLNPNDGNIVLTDGSSRYVRYVGVTLEDGKVTCTVARPK